MDTDAETKFAAMTEWVNCLKFMWEAIEKKPEQSHLDSYVRAFKNVPLGLLEKAIERAVANNGVYKTVPTIGAVWDSIRKEIGDARPDLDMMDAIEEWKERSFEKCVIRFEVCHDEDRIPA